MHLLLCKNLSRVCFLLFLKRFATKKFSRKLFISKGFKKVFMGWQYQTKGKSLVTLKSWPGLLSRGIIFIFVWISVLYPLTFILFMWFNLINLTYIELPIKDETSETTVRNVNCLFRHISWFFAFRNFFFVKSLNKPVKDHIQCRRNNLNLGSSNFKIFKSSLHFYPLWLNLYIKWFCIILMFKDGRRDDVMKIYFKKRKNLPQSVTSLLWNIIFCLYTVTISIMRNCCRLPF